MNSNLLIYILIAIFAIFIVISIIKKAIKLILFLILLLLAFSAYNILVKGNSPLQEYNNVKLDMAYGKSVTEYTIKIKNSVDNFKKAAENEKADKNVITVENKNLHKYKIEVENLKHTEKLNGFHSKYCGLLNSIILGTDETEKLIKIGDISNSKHPLNNINSAMDELLKLKNSK